MKGSNLLSDKLKFGFHPWMTTVIITYVMIAIVLMMYALVALFFGFPPLDANNPFIITDHLKDVDATKIMLFIVSLSIILGVVMFVFFASKEILEQRVLYDFFAKIVDRSDFIRRAFKIFR